LGGGDGSVPQPSTLHAARPSAVAAGDKPWGMVSKLLRLATQASRAVSG
jgi:hypothetical protein